MKTQISRDSFQPEQRYSGVYLQQGRMLTDADWNELTDIEKVRLVEALRDAISGTTTPAGAVAGGSPRVGGLRIIADPVDSDKLFIQPGTLYVEGVPARLAAPTNLPINGQPDFPIQADYNGQSVRLYADVWERTVTGLEQTGLMDAALHGADTATRTQTMVQVKWCSSTGTGAVDPMNPAANPPQGTGLMTLKLTLIAASADSCDPCASQVKVDERLGNYLFRVEVHDYDPATGLLTLKWSRDNGAEACRVAEMPTGFAQGDWVWEYFDNDTERLLGNHFVTNAKKVRGLIKETCSTPIGVHEPKTYVRQWDGYLRINLSTQAIVAGRDRGVALVTGPVASSNLARLGSGAVDLGYATLLKAFAPPAAILVNASHQLVHSYGEVHAFLRIREGQASLDINRILPDALIPVAAALLFKCARENTSVTSDVVRLSLPPNPALPEVQEAFENGSIKSFARHSRLGATQLGSVEQVREDFMNSVEYLRGLGFNRVTLKTGSYGMEELAMAIKFSTDAQLDLLTIDGSGGGTGMSPWNMMQSWGVPSVILLAKAHEYANMLAAKGRQVVDMSFAGGFALEDHIFKALALGAPYTKLVCMGRAIMIPGFLGSNIEGALNPERKEKVCGNWDSLPKTVKDIGETPEQIFAGYESLKAKIGADEMKTVPYGAIAAWTLADKLGAGLQQLLAGARKFSVTEISRDDIVSGNRETAQETGIRFITDVQDEIARKILS